MSENFARGGLELPSPVLRAGVVGQSADTSTEGEYESPSPGNVDTSTRVGLELLSPRLRPGAVGRNIDASAEGRLELLSLGLGAGTVR